MVSEINPLKAPWTRVVSLVLVISKLVIELRPLKASDSMLEVSVFVIVILLQFGRLGKALEGITERLKS